MQIIDCQTYEIWLGDPWIKFGSWLESRAYTSIAVLVDENTRIHCLPKLLNSVRIEKDRIIEIHSGEQYKNLDSCIQIWDGMIRSKLDRKSLLINLGGGVIGDMGGFCAGTFMRGIDFVQIPTTLLAQVDASVGSKLGVDFQNFKNLIGLFQDPQLVIMDPGFFDTLAEIELISGFAEIIKHALIRDKILWNELKLLDSVQDVDWMNLVHRNVQIKKAVVESDERESGLRKILNFGHTIGHAVEACYLRSSKPLTHGQAIAAGMICESFLSNHLLGLPGSDMKELRGSITRLFPLPESLFDRRDEIFRYIESDKKNIGNKWMFSLLDQIGHCQYDIPVEKDLIAGSLKYFDALQNKVV